MTRLDPLPFGLWGAHIDRDTLANLARAGFPAPVVRPRWGDVVLDIEVAVSFRC